MTSDNPRDAITNVLHADNYAAYTRGAEARMYGQPLPAEAHGISDRAYWCNEGFHLRPFAPLTSDRDYARIQREATTIRASREGLAA